AGWTWRAAAADTASAPGDAALLCLDRPSSFPSASWLRAVSWGLPGICAADCSWGPAGAALVVPAALGTVDPLALPPLLHALAADPSRGREVAARGRAHLEALHAPATVAAVWRAP